MDRKIAWLLLGLVALLVQGCGGQVTSVRADTLVVRKTAPMNGMPSWTRTVKNARSVERLAKVLLSLKPAPQGPTACPADYGTVYHLTFKYQGKTVLTATADGSGCEGAEVQGRAVWTMKSSFWSTLAQTLGVPEMTLNAMGRVRAPSDLAFGQTIAFWNERAGLVAGTALGAPAGFVTVTTDGGKTFAETFASPDPVLSVGVGPYPRAWVATGSCDGGHCRVSLYQSADGGESWELMRTMPEIPQHLDPGGLGWGFIPKDTPPDSALLTLTQDGGKTWHVVASSATCPKGPYMKYGPALASFPEPDEGYLVCAGQPGAGQQLKELMVTHDAGKTWTLISQDFFAGGYASGLVSRPDGRGWYWGARAMMMATTDGGRAWRTLSLAQPDVTTVLSADLLTDRLGYALIEGHPVGGTALMRTNDFGRTWTRVMVWPFPH